MNLFEELKWRGLIKDVSNEELAKKLLNDEKITFYCGFDPTADSLTIGHLVQIMRLRFLEQYGHQPIVLIGGGTGLIGDPSGRSSERKLLTLEETLANANKIKTQFKNIYLMLFITIIMTGYQKLMSLSFYAIMANILPSIIC